MLQYVCSGPTPYKPMSLIMRMSRFLQHASMAPYNWESDTLDMKASPIMALQLALDLQAHWLTPVQLNRSQPWLSPSSLILVPLALARTHTDSLMGHQTKLPVWLASIKVMNDKYHSPTAVRPLLSSHSNSELHRLIAGMACIMFCAVWSRLEYILSC